jgi:hypothetical protein
MNISRRTFLSIAVLAVLGGISKYSLAEVPDLVLKMVGYRDAISFPLPISWVEEDERGVQGTFYEPGDSSGTLRVSVMQWTGTDEQDRNSILKSALLPGSIETLKKGIYLKKELKAGEEDGEALVLHRWIVALALPGHVCRIFIFTHTITEANEEDSDTIKELQIVDYAVRNAVYSYEPEIPLTDGP